jgi:hypothetical protein
MRGIRLIMCCGALALTTAAGACGDKDSTSPDAALTVSGDWRGVVTFPNGFTTTMTLTQTGTAVSGRMSVTGVFLDRTFTGQVNAQGRTLMWGVARDCELWAGVLNIDATGRQMSGAVATNGSGCQPVRANASGTLSLTKQ